MVLDYRTVPSNGIDMQVAEAGDPDAPLVVLGHGFPELSYSWRHQLPALAEAGYHAVAPDQRGYGGTTRPDAVEDYDIDHLTGDLLGLLDALGHEQAVFVGHDWGAPVVWNVALRAPERVRGVVGMSVPYLPRSDFPPLQIMRQLFTGTWFYILYFQEPGVADADLARDPDTTMRRFLCAIDGNLDADTLGALVGERDARGMVDRLPEPARLPDWLSQDELDHFVAAFRRTGFTGGVNWYRNLDRNWELTADLAGAKVEVPALYIGGVSDPVLMMTPPAGMADTVSDLRGIVLVEGAGHWVQQERPHEVNAALLDFLRGLDADAAHERGTV
jgi:pimeloyl-ACP methyl ester carboxylesterase